MVRDKGCASVAAAANDVDSEAAMFRPNSGRLPLPRLQCILLSFSHVKAGVTRKASVEMSHQLPSPGKH